MSSLPSFISAPPAGAPVVFLGSPLTLATVEAVAFGRARVAISDEVRERVAACRQYIDDHLSSNGEARYGIDTGFGALADVRIDHARIADLQLNLVRSHACGVGAPLPDHEARAMMLLRAQVLAQGHSGVRPVVLDTLAACLNAGVTAVIPEKGSVGASGDLAPLAHLALVLIGEGEARVAGVVMTGGQALALAEVAPVVLAAKEGLCLINGTQTMTAIGALLLQRADRVAKTADLIGALSLEALTGTPRAFDARVQELRPFDGQRRVAENVRRLLDGSGIVLSHADCKRVQDPYSLRCIPQVHGAVRQVIGHVAEVLTVELNAVTDNPLVMADGDIVSGGNFHGQPIAFALDYLAIGLSELASISERRIEQMVNPHLSVGLPAFLTPDVGLNSGFMIAQVTAAALVSENKRLAVPASVDSIPSSANREDHVSMGTHAAVKARAVLENVETVLGVELLCACQGIEFRRPHRSSPALEAVQAVLRARVPKLERDRVLYLDMRAAAELVRDGMLVAAAEATIGPLA